MLLTAIRRSPFIIPTANVLFRISSYLTQPALLARPPAQSLDHSFTRSISSSTTIMAQRSVHVSVTSSKQGISSSSANRDDSAKSALLGNRYSANESSVPASNSSSSSPIKISASAIKLKTSSTPAENLPSSKIVKLRKRSRKSSTSSLSMSPASDPASKLPSSSITSSSSSSSTLSSPSDTPLHRAASVLKSGGIVALPTDTLYGLAGLAQSTEAVRRIYNVKERHDEKPLSICVGNIEDVYKWAEVHCEQSILQRLLPGPVTLLFRRRPELNPDLNPGVSSIGIRIPDDDFIRQLCIRVDEPLALTSANASAAQSTLSVEEFEYLWPKIDLIIDGGPIGRQEEEEEEEGEQGEEEDGATPMKRRKSALASSASSASSPSSSAVSSSSSSSSVSREGSTVVDLSKPGRFRIVRPGSAHLNTVNVLKTEYGMEEDE